MSSTTGDWLILAVIVAVLGGAGYWYLERNRVAEPTPAPTAAVVPEQSAPSSAPRYPVPGPTVETPEDLVDLPPLNDSDAYFNLALEDLFGNVLDAMLVESGGVERFVTTVDNLPRSTLSERLRPVSPVANALVVEPAGDNLFELSAANYERYANYVLLFEQADTDAIVDSYRRFYPLLQEAYRALGYPTGHFNDRLVEVIDHLLETPDIEQPVRLKRPHVLYEYADPSIEALSSGQKVLLRIGPDNARRIKEKLAELRQRLTALESDS